MRWNVVMKRMYCRRSPLRNQQAAVLSAGLIIVNSREYFCAGEIEAKMFACRDERLGF